MKTSGLLCRQNVRERYTQGNKEMRSTKESRDRYAARAHLRSPHICFPSSAPSSFHLVRLLHVHLEDWGVHCSLVADRVLFCFSVTKQIPCNFVINGQYFLEESIVGLGCVLMHICARTLHGT